MDQVDWIDLPTGPVRRGTPADETAAVARGGAFRHDRDLARCARRHGAYEEDLAAIGVGFRLAAPPAAA